jgi:glycosyltransferase involved in cell wall biosynthesis
MNAHSPAGMRHSEGASLRILLITGFYPPVIGGVEVHVQTLARGLVARGHEVVVATLATGENGVGERLDEGVRVRALQGAVQRIGPLFTTERRHAIPMADPEITHQLQPLGRGVLARHRPRAQLALLFVP